MNVVLNGERRELADATTVAGLLAALSLPERKVAIERNREIVPKSLYAETPLRDGDVIEVVTFVGGG